MKMTARLLQLLVAFGVASALVLAAAPAAAVPISDVSELIRAEDEGPTRFRAAPLTGPNFWIDFVSTRNGRIVRTFSDDVPGGGVLEVSRFANVLAVGFEWANDLLALRVSNAIWDAGRLDTPGAGSAQEAFGFFTSPAALLSFRPLWPLRIDVDAAYAWGMEGRGKDGDGWTHHLVTGGVHLVAEPVRRYFGTNPQFEFAAGIRTAWAKANFDPDAPTPNAEVSGVALLFGGHIASTVPLGDDVALFFALGAYYGLDPADASAGNGEDHLNLEWSAGLRWYPYGG